MQQTRFNKKNVCSRCGKNLTKQVKILGDMALTIHRDMHYHEDVQTYIELAYVLANKLKELGYEVEEMKTLQELDPGAYKRKITFKKGDK